MCGECLSVVGHFPGCPYEPDEDIDQDEHYAELIDREFDRGRDA